MQTTQLNKFQRFDVWLEKIGFDDYETRINVGASLFFVSIIVVFISIPVGIYGITSTLTSLACG